LSKKFVTPNFFVFDWFFHGHVPGKNTLTRRIFCRK